jgi:hypothetical protein
MGTPTTVDEELAWLGELAKLMRERGTFTEHKTHANRIEGIATRIEQLRTDRNALLQKPIDLAKMDSADDEEGVPEKMVAYYWCEQATEARAQVEQLRKALEKYEGPNAGTWYYPEGDTSSDACCHSEYEVLDERYFDYDGPKTGVFSIERAVALPPLYAAVHAFTDAEKDERDSDDEYEVTFHVTADEARAALTGEHNG